MKRHFALIPNQAISLFARMSGGLGVATALNALVLLPFLQACTTAPASEARLPLLVDKSPLTSTIGQLSDPIRTASMAATKPTAASLATAAPDFAPPGAGGDGMTIVLLGIRSSISANWGDQRGSHLSQGPSGITIRDEETSPLSGKEASE